MYINVTSDKALPVSPIKSETTANNGENAYENLRKRNLMENMKVLQETVAAPNFVTVASFRASTRAPPKKKVKVERKEVAPRRQSLRVAGKAPDGTEAAVQRAEQMRIAIEDSRPVKLTGPLPLRSVDYDSGLEDDEKKLIQGEEKAFIEELTALKPNKGNLSKSKTAAFSKGVEVTLNEKVTKERIYSVAVYPSNERTVVSAGDKWGRIGMAISSGSDEPMLMTYKPHTQPVYWMQHDMAAPWKLWSASRDGLVRIMDVKEEKFLEVFNGNDNEGYGNSLYGGDLADGGNVFIIGDEDGSVVCGDARAPDAQQTWSDMHERKINTVSVNQADNNLFATCSNDRFIRLWDRRMIRAGSRSNKCIRHFQTGLCPTSAYFDPRGTSLLVTSNDNKIMLWDVNTTADWAAPKASTNKAETKHNNHTGRWITAFRAVWDPKNKGASNAFAIGNMDRSLDMYSTDPATRAISHTQSMRSDDVTAIPAVVCWHPCANAVATGNASGRVQLWRHLD